MRTCASVFCVIVLLASPVVAADSEGGGASGGIEMAEQQDHPFMQGRLLGGVSGGTAGAPDGGRYAILGGSLGYFLVDGFSAGMGLSFMFGASPFIVRVKPRLRYIFWFVPYVKPYIGPHYQHWFVTDGSGDLDSVGGSLGAFFRTGNAFLGVGVMYDRYLNGCTTRCNAWGPEIQMAF